MMRLRLTILILPLSACLFVLNAWLPAQIVGHAKQHSHHSAATHADPLCTLICSAGHVVHGATVVFSSDFAPAARLEVIAVSQIWSTFSRLHFSRGPPSFLLSIAI